MERKRTPFEKIIVNLWAIVVFCGVGMLALELPALLSDLLGIDLDTFTVKALILIGCFALYAKAKEIKDSEAKEELFDQIQKALEQHNSKS